MQVYFVILALVAATSSAFVPMVRHTRRLVVREASVADQLAITAPKFAAAAKAAGIDLTDDTTVFAPTDEAMDAHSGDVNAGYHVMKVRKSEMRSFTTAEWEMTDGNILQTSKGNTGYFLDAAPLVQGDIECDNGYIHTIGGVLTPNTWEREANPATEVGGDVAGQGIGISKTLA